MHNSEDSETIKSNQEEPSKTATSNVDTALIRLDNQLQNTSQEVADLRERLDSLLKVDEAEFLKDKWNETLALWLKAQRDVEAMKEELVEDKSVRKLQFNKYLTIVCRYLTVYRTVSKQAEDMMQSLEKIFAQCHDFVHVSLFPSEVGHCVLMLSEYTQEMHHRYGSASISMLAATQISDQEAVQGDLNTFLSLHRSLHQKTSERDLKASCLMDIRLISTCSCLNKNTISLRAPASSKSSIVG